MFAESQEIHSCNPWLTYGPGLHRLREFGCGIKVILVGTLLTSIGNECMYIHTYYFTLGIVKVLVFSGDVSGYGIVKR